MTPAHGPPSFNPPLPAREIITGERLQKLADLSLVPSHIRHFHRHVDRYARELLTFEDYAELGETEIVRIASKRSLFVYTHELPAFVEQVWPRLGGAGYVLITHNSDHGVDPMYADWLDDAGAKLRRWFAQNALFSHPKLVPLPIGIANRMWEHGNVRVLHRVARRCRRWRKTELLAINFHPGTHPSRLPARDALWDAFPQLAVERQRPSSYRGYLEELALHRFCACPRGNGIDTHRLWECLYLGVVPIVERSPHTEHWCNVGLPLLLVDDWSEVTRSYLHEQERRFATNPTVALPEQLYVSYYARLIQAAANGADR
ncbi:MAG: hypothetical protein ACYCXW_02510 [Solirubrobacteraceae bacterium]